MKAKVKEYHIKKKSEPISCFLSICRKQYQILTGLYHLPETTLIYPSTPTLNILLQVSVNTAGSWDHWKTWFLSFKTNTWSQLKLLSFSQPEWSMKLKDSTWIGYSFSQTSQIKHFLLIFFNAIFSNKIEKIIVAARETDINIHGIKYCKENSSEQDPWVLNYIPWSSRMYGAVIIYIHGESCSFHASTEIFCPLVVIQTSNLGCFHFAGPLVSTTLQKALNLTKNNASRWNSVTNFKTCSWFLTHFNNASNLPS